MNKSLEKAKQQIEDFEAQVKAITPDPQGKLPVLQEEQQTKLAQRQIDQIDGILLKPSRSISSKEKFNENFREDYEFARQNVRFIAENKEIIGEAIELWTKSFPGTTCEFWTVPVNKVVIGPRYLAEQIAKKAYTKYVMEENVRTGSDYAGEYTGAMVATHRIQRLEARPAAGFNKQSSFN